VGELIDPSAARRALRRYLDQAGTVAMEDAGEDGPLASRPTFQRYAELMEWAARLPPPDPRLQQLAMVVDDSTRLFEVASPATLELAVRYQRSDPLETPDNFLDRLTASLLGDWIDSVTGGSAGPAPA
jgi:hypothetical protein